MNSLTLLPLLALASANWIDPPMSGWLEKVTQEPVTSGNKLELLVDGTQFYPVFRRLINDANSSIDIAMSFWCNDDAGLQIAQDLVAARARGVRVRVIIDYFNFMPHDRAYMIMERGGVRPLLFNPPNWGLDQISQHMHEKILITDGKDTMIGGANICDEYMTGTTKKLWHDLELHAQGALVGRVQKRFDDTWNWMATTEYETRLGYATVLESPDYHPHIHRSFLRYKPTPTPLAAEPPGDGIAMYEYQQPYWHSKDSKTYLSVFTQLIGRATQRVIFYDPYFLPPKALEKALVEAARKGIRVDILTNSVSTNDMGEPINTSQKSHYEALIQAGAHIHEVFDTTLHAKGILIDRTVLTMGSHNFTHRSFSSNGESNILTGDLGVITRFEEMAAFDFTTRSREISLATAHLMQRQIHHSLWQRFLTWLGNLF